MSIYRSNKSLFVVIVGYLLLGIIVSIVQWFITNPALLESCPEYVAQFKCSSLTVRFIEILKRPDFWWGLPIWPLKFVFGVFLAN